MEILHSLPPGVTEDPQQNLPSGWEVWDEGGEYTYYNVIEDPYYERRRRCTVLRRRAKRRGHRRGRGARADEAVLDRGRPSMKRSPRRSCRRTPRADEVTSRLYF